MSGIHGRTVPNLALMCAAVLLLHGCAKREQTAGETPGGGGAVHETTPGTSTPSSAGQTAGGGAGSGETKAVSSKFADRKWRVASASTSIAPGTIYEFRSGGTLVITTPGSPPMEGTWGLKNGAMTMVEDGIPYKVDILSQTPDEFRIRSHNPGGAVDIRLVPAGQ